MKRDGKFWNWLIWTLFVLLIGIGLGMFYRIKQIEPAFEITQAEIKESHKLLVKDFTELDIRLTLLEKKIHGMRVKK